MTLQEGPSLLNLQLAVVKSDWEGTNAIAIGKRAYQLLAAWFSSKDKALAQWRMLSAREVPAGAISREPLSILLHTSIFKCLKTTYHEPKLGKPGFSPRVSFSVVIKQTTRRQNCVLLFQPWTVEGTRKTTTPGSGWIPFREVLASEGAQVESLRVISPSPVLVDFMHHFCT